MDIQNVFIIIGKKWTKDKVVDNLKGENYKHNFYFANTKDFSEMVKQLNIADEVWTFGECDSIPIFKYVERNQIDIWRMG